MLGFMWIATVSFELEVAVVNSISACDRVQFHLTFQILDISVTITLSETTA